MNFPSLPTDSLVKFQAVGGLALVASLFAFVFLELRFIEDTQPQIKADYETSAIEYEMLEAKTTFLRVNREGLLVRLKQIDSDILKARCPSAKCESLMSERSDLEARAEKMIVEGQNLERQIFALASKQLQTRARAEVVGSRIETYQQLRWVYLLLSGLGFYFMLNGFYKWGAKEALEHAKRKPSTKSN